MATVMWKKYRYRVIEREYIYVVQRRFLFKWDDCIVMEVVDGNRTERTAAYHKLESAIEKIKCLTRKPRPIQVVYVHK